MALAHTVGLGMVGSATTMLARRATRRAMHRPGGDARLPRAAHQNKGLGMVLLLAAAAGVILALADVLQEQRQHATRG